MKSPFAIESEPFTTLETLEPEPAFEFEEEQHLEDLSSDNRSVCHFGFRPRAVESPGGGRVTKKTTPNRADMVNVPGVARPIPLHSLAAAAWKALVAAARVDGIRHPLLLPTSGFRDLETQTRRWEWARKQYGSVSEARKWVAPPGHSPHQSGRAIDFYLGGKNNSANVAALRRLPAYQWLVQNAVCFGFYPYAAEPWHWEYNPPANAGTISGQGEAGMFGAEEEFSFTGYPKSVLKAVRSGSERVAIGAPRLIKREERPAASTLYVHVPLGSENPARPMTGIFIPENYVPRQQVDLILYLHGHKTTRVCGPGASASIDGYWRSRYWPFREEINSSGKNVILVAPTLGSRSEAGSLTSPAVFEAYLDKVLAALTAYGPYRNSGRSPTIGNVILACHSGGGSPMRSLALGNHRYADRIRECWCFDSLYHPRDPELWAGWARSRASARLSVHYLGSTQRLSKQLKDKQLPNVVVEKSTAQNHCWVPLEHWRSRVQASTFLLGR